MRFEFKLDPDNQYEFKLIPEFCRVLVNSISDDIKSLANKEKLHVRESAILNSNWIVWKKKPDSINMIKMYHYIADSIECRPLDNDMYVVKFKDANLPNSSTQIDLVARYLDYGGIAILPMPIISRIFNKYRMRSSEYWKSFVSHKLKVIKVDKAVTVR